MFTFLLSIDCSEIGFFLCTHIIVSNVQINVIMQFIGIILLDSLSAQTRINL